MGECSCIVDDQSGHNASELIRAIFHDCVYSTADYWSFVLGWISLVISMVCVFPQLSQNFHSKSTQGLSTAFVLSWLFGDMFNLLACILGRQVLTQQITGLYFCLVDIVLLCQLAMYRNDRVQPEYILLTDNGLNEQQQQQQQPWYSRSKPLLIIPLVLVIGVISFRVKLSQPDNRKSLMTGALPSCIDSTTLTPLELLSTSLVSWASGLLYFLSRIPQVYQNWISQSCSGLSISMFILTLASNCTYGAAILLRFPAMNAFFFAVTFPFLVGSLGTLVFDACILYQLITYPTIKSQSNTDTEGGIAPIH